MDDEKISGTCQACFRRFAIRGKLNTMVHHGYERPGYGYIVGDCWGVGAKPYELDVQLMKSWQDNLLTKVIPSLRREHQNISTCDWFEWLVPDRANRQWGMTANLVVVKFQKGIRPEGNALSYAYSFEDAQKNALYNLKHKIDNTQKIADELNVKIREWVYAPEKLVREKRKSGVTIHAKHPRRPNRSWCSPMSTRHMALSDDVSKITCSRCLAHIEKKSA